MTFNALMLPALPPPSAAGLKTAGDPGPTRLKSGRIGKSENGRASFLDTFNDVSIRPRGSHPKSTPAKMSGAVAAGSGKEPQDISKPGHADGDSPDRVVEKQTAAPAERSARLRSSRDFGKAQPGFCGFSVADDGVFSDKAISETADGWHPVFMDCSMGYFQPQEQRALIDWLADGGPLGPMQADISLDAGSRYAFERLAAEGAGNRELGVMLGAPAEFIDLERWLASLPEVTLKNPAGPPGANGETLLAALLNMWQNAAAAAGLNADSAGAAGQDAGNWLEALKLNEDAFFNQVTLQSPAAESDPLENAKALEDAKAAGAGKDAFTAWWAAADSNSEKSLQASARELLENSRFPGMQADPKAAAEYSASPNSVVEGVAIKPTEELLSFKNPVLKSESLLVAESGGKITPLEGDGRENSFLFTQDHMPEHLKTLESAARASEGARSGLTYQTTDQIVQKAVLLLNNNQHEVHLDLKPEFLGHIRMQIVTESQQVTIKIVTEFAFVKDMLESNFNQLKAELQAQGLQIDELEVSVAHDSHADGELNQKPAETVRLREMSEADASADSSAEKQKQSQDRNADANGQTAIDYFA